jgi:hypothetical protein
MATALTAGDTDFADALSKLDDNKKKQLADMYKGAAPFAYQALKLPYEQRKNYVQQISPQLEAAGWTPDKIAGFDPTDANLGAIVQGNMSLEQAMARDKVDYKEVIGGARLVPFDSSGRPLTHDNGETPASSGGSAPLTASHNNPGALRKPGSSEFQSFATPEAGIAAQETLLGHYMQRGLTNVSSIVETYAPRQSRGGDNTDAQVENYKAYVARRLGVNPADTLSPVMLPKLAAAMREFETGHRAKTTSSPATIRAHAQEAIAAGADPEQVKARAAAMGVAL